MKIAFYPVITENKSIDIVKEILRHFATVIDYKKLIGNRKLLDECDAFYLNWIENDLTDQDKDLLKEAAKRGIHILWMFHNRFSHDKEINEKSKEDFSFMINIASTIGIHSYNSKQYLLEYTNDLDMNKVVFIPHVSFIGQYGEWQFSSPQITELQKADFIFGFMGLIRPYKNIEVLIRAFLKANLGEKVNLVIAGEAKDIGYVNYLQSLAEDDRIVFIPNRIPDIQMGSFIHLCDCLVLPYNTKSSINSGVMINSFSFERTVIVSDISMAQDYPDELIYRYSTENTNSDAHINALSSVMRKVYHDGRGECLRKGQLLKKMIELNNSWELIENLYKHIFMTENHDEVEMAGTVDTNIWKNRYDIAIKWIDYVYNDKDIAQILINNGHHSIGIYGFGKIGRILYKELTNNDKISVCAIIDRKNFSYESEIPQFGIHDALPNMDCLIITAAGVDSKMLLDEIDDAEAIKNIVSLEDLLLVI